MPSKGTGYKTGKRNLIMNPEFFDEVREELGIDMSDQDIRKIIVTSNDEIREAVVAGDDAFKLPEQLGYLVITKYKSHKKPVDWINSRKFKKKVPLLNLHSFNYIYHIKWFKKSDRRFATQEVYKLEPARKFKRQVALNVKSGRDYHTWYKADFWNMNKVIKKFKNG